MKLINVPNGKTEMTGQSLTDDLKKRVARGGAWIFLMRFIDQGLFIIRITILARLLSQYDFGLMGIAMLTLAVLETFSQTGIRDALIQKKENTQEYLNTAWTIAVIRGLVIFTILFLIAPSAAKFFNAPQARLIIQAFGLSALFKAATNIGVINFQKELEFKKQFFYEVSGIVVNFVVMVALAIILRNAWALVFGFLARAFTQLIVSYIIHPHIPRISLKWKQAKELLSFGKWVFGSSILIFLVTQGDDILVGKMLGAAMLGFYQMAYKISNTPTTEISYNIAQLTFPTYSKLQDDPPRLKSAYLRFLQMTCFLSFIAAGLIFILAPDIVEVFLGSKWMPMVPAMQILALAGLVRALINTTDPLLFGVGKPGIETRWQLVRFVVLAALIYPLTHLWGLFGASLAVFLSLFVSSFGFSWFAVNISRCSWGEYLKMIGVPLISATSAVLSILGLKTFLGRGLPEFILFGLTGVIVYLGMAFLFDRLWGFQIFGLMRQVFHSILGTGNNNDQ